MGKRRPIFIIYNSLPIDINKTKFNSGLVKQQEYLEIICEIHNLANTVYEKEDSKTIYGNENSNHSCIK